MPLNKCIKITIKSCEEFDYKSINNILRDIRYKTCQASNEAIRMLYMHTYESMKHKTIYGNSIDVKSLCGKSFDAHIDDDMKIIMDICQTGNIAQTRQFVTNRFNDDKKKELLKNEVKLSNFKNDIPIIIHNNSFKVIQTDKNYIIQCGLFNRSHNISLGRKANDRVSFVLDKMDNNKKITLNKIMSGQYERGS